MIGPTNPPTSGACLTFWYHMYGRTMGTLNVYALAGGALGRPIWTKIGNQANKWINAQVTVVSKGSWQVSKGNAEII